MRKIRAEVEEKILGETKVKEEPSVRVSKGNDFFEAIEGVSTTKAKKEKDKMMTLAPPEKIRKMVDEVVHWKQKEKEAKAEKEASEVDVLAWVKERQDTDGFNNDFQKSYRVQGIKDTVTYVSSDKFSPIKPEDLPTLREAIGKRFDELIEKQTTVMLREEVVSGPRSQELQSELMGLFKTVYGDEFKEKFQAFFIAETAYLATDGFDRKLYTLSRKIVERVRDLVKQTKASLK